jgi:hypothetical protein
MSDSQLLTAVRAAHTAVYLVMVSAILVLLYAGATAYVGVWLWVSLGLLGAETVVFVGNGFKCPLTALAVRYGATTGVAFDTFLPERVTRYTFRFFGSLMVVGLLTLIARHVGTIG